MERRFTLILNPAAGHRSVRKRRAEIEALLRRSGAPHEVVETRHPGHAAELARAAAEAGRIPVAVGGDGTVQEVASGVFACGGQGVFGVLPLGTGNDFVKMIGMPLQVREAVRLLLEAPAVPVDCGRVRWRQPGLAGEQIFVNAVGIGFDARVAFEVSALKFLPGVHAYLAAVFKTLRGWDSPSVTIHLSRDGEAEHPWFRGGLFLVTGANGICSGGGFYLTPGASVQDGLLDVCAVEALGVGRVLGLIPRVMRGTHLGAPEVHLAHARRFRLSSAAPLPVHADGEVLTLEAREVEIEIIPGGLSVLSPAVKP